MSLVVVWYPRRFTSGQQICYCFPAAGGKVLIKLLCFSKRFSESGGQFSLLNRQLTRSAGSAASNHTDKCCYLFFFLFFFLLRSNVLITLYSHPRTDVPHPWAAWLSSLSDVHCLCKKRHFTNSKSQWRYCAARHAPLSFSGVLRWQWINNGNKQSLPPALI